MLRRFLKRRLPDQRQVRAQPALRLLGGYLHNRELWQLTRRSTARAAALGLFCSMLPIPVQMLVAAVIAIVIGCNLPVALAMCWVTNPLTMAPVYFAAYTFGTRLLGIPPRAVEFEMSFEWFLTKLDQIWLPLLVGCLVMGAAAAVVGYFGTRLLWRIAVIREWRNRRRTR